MTPFKYLVAASFNQHFYLKGGLFLLDKEKWKLFPL
jgi:hypothetical protein